MAESDFFEKRDNFIQNQRVEITDFPQILVPEKIIFVIDVLLFANENKNEVNTNVVLSLCKSYFNVKKKICVKPAKFECMLHSSNAVVHSSVENTKDFKTALMQIQNLECEDETEPLKIDCVFNKIASLVELPGPESLKKGLPPNWVYHVIWLFGRNYHIPTMENTNSFDYLMMTPYFALDILYVFNKNLEKNKCEEISQALLGLNENGQGYFLSASITENSKAFSCFSQFLGHPLMRVPQIKAKFNILELDNENNYNNDDDDVKNNREQQ